ncbi:MAG: SDR family NAD(P)-dependent oxidoreductase [Sphingomonadales bacterium]|nr:SDR family NAD(P)-dependent oxidoreductase [Sphingomonadales bacterium]
MAETIRFDGKVAIVTGAGGGLGKEYARLLAQRGAHVLVNDLGGDFTGNGSDAGYAAAAAEEICSAGGSVAANTDTVDTPAGAAAIVADAVARWGRVDILVNNAGIVSGGGPIATITDKQWDDDMRVSASGTFYMCRAVWEMMKANGFGRIVNVCSGSWFGMGSGVPYPAAKGAVWAMTRALGSAARANGWNIRTNAVMPIAGSRMTELMGPEINAMMHRDFPARAVAPVVAMLAHDAAPCTGEMFTVGGGGYARVFAGVTAGYRATDKDWQPEDAFANFDTAFSAEQFTIPADSMDDASLYVSDVPWDVFRQFIA